MTTTAEAIRAVLLRELDTFAREVESYPDDETVWQSVPGVTNSCGNLALHVAGNLQHFVGAVLGATGYVRDREAEFGRRSGTRVELVGELIRARETVAAVLHRLPAAQLAEVYPETIAGKQLVTEVFLVHLSTHLAFHLGQAGYLRRTLTGENRSTAPVSIPALADRLAARESPGS